MPTAKTSVKTVNAPVANDRNRPVSIRLFKDNGKYANDVFVNVNDHRFLIKRGVEVTVPWYVAEVLRQSMEQDEATANAIAVLQTEHDSMSRQIG